MADASEPPKLRILTWRPAQALNPDAAEEPVVVEPAAPANIASEDILPTRMADDHLGDVADAVRSGGVGSDGAQDGSQPHRRRSEGDYEVGYGKPPKEHQFQKGSSPNIKGRPRGSLSLKTELKLVVGQLVAVTENGKRSKRSTLAVLLMKLRADALAGKPKAVDQLIKLILTQLPDEVARDYRETAAADAALLARFKARMT